MTGSWHTRFHQRGIKGWQLTWVEILRDSKRFRHVHEIGERITLILLPFLPPVLQHVSTFWWILCGPSIFYHIWSWPSADNLRESDHDHQNLRRHTIPYSTSSKSPFWLRLGSRETPQVSHPSTEAKHCLRRNHRRRARAVWDRCKLSTPPRDSKTGKPTCSCRRREKPFLPPIYHSGGTQAYLTDPPWNHSCERITHSEKAAWWSKCSRSSILSPNSIGCGFPPVTSQVTLRADLK